MTATEQFNEILKVFDSLPRQLTLLTPVIQQQSNEQDFILVDHTSEPEAQFDCYAQLEPNTR